METGVLPDRFEMLVEAWVGLVGVGRREESERFQYLIGVAKNRAYPDSRNDQEPVRVRRFKGSGHF